MIRPIDTTPALVIATLISALAGVAPAQAEPDATLEAAEATGGLRYSILVNEFRNDARNYRYWSHPQPLGGACAAMLTSALDASGHFIVLADKSVTQDLMGEIDFSQSEWVKQGDKTPKKGKFTPAQLAVQGVITHVQHDVGGGKVSGVRIPGTSVGVGGKKQSAEMNMTIYMVDVETRQVIATADVVGKSSTKGIGLSNLPKVGGRFDAYAKDNAGKAAMDAIEKATEWLVEQLDDVQWKGKVVSVKSGRIIINRGTREGVKKGQTFAVGQLDEIIDPDTGETLYVEMTATGRIRVTDAKEKVAFCEPIGGGGAIESGMSVFVEE